MDVRDLRARGLLVPWEVLRPETTETVKYLLWDAVLALIAGVCSMPEEERRTLLPILEEEPRRCRPVWPPDTRVSLEMAGFLNGFCIRYADWGDAMRPPRSRAGHPSDMCAAMLALCDDPALSGKRVIEALNLGYRLWVLVQNRMMYKRPEFDPTTYLTLTLPVMTAVCRGADGGQIQNVLNLSASSGTTLLQVRPHDITNLKCGATGYAIARVFWLWRMSRFLEAPGSMFTGPNGWYKVVAELDDAPEPMDDEAVYQQIQVKALPCCNVIQAAAECGIRLHRRLNGDSGRIRAITVRVSPTDAGIALKPGKPKYPFDHPSADHHLMFCLAAALKYGTLSPLHYAEEQFRDPELRRLIDCASGVVLTEDELTALGGGKGPCAVELTLEDGTVLAERLARPSGYFVGASAGERLAGLRTVTATKRGILEQCYGLALGSAEAIALSLESRSASELLDAIRAAIG